MGNLPDEISQDQKERKHKFRILFDLPNIVIAILLVIGTSIGKLLALCAGPSKIGGKNLNCLDKILDELESAEDVLSFITYPFGPIFSWTIGDTWPSIILGFLVLFFVALICAYILRRFYRSLKR